MRSKGAAADIRRLSSELEAANQNHEALLYSVSHDLRAPLRHIQGYVEILQSAAAPWPDQTSRQHLQTLAQSATELGQKLDALLELSRMGRAEMQIEPVKLAALVKEVQRELGTAIKGRDIEWQIGNLPEVQGDPPMLRQVLVQLLSNAIKFTRTRAQAKIQVGAQNQDRATILFVRDNGVGFDMTYARRLFGVFQRLHPSSEFEGVGVGLAKVRRLIHRHGGRTWAEGTVEGGATFSCSLPNPPEEAP